MEKCLNFFLKLLATWKKKFWKSLKFKAESVSKSLRKFIKHGSKKPEKSRSGVGLGPLGGDLGTKNLLKTGLVDFGRFWPGSDRPKSRPNGPRWRQVGAKMAPRWSKLGLRWPSWGHLGRYLEHFWWSWERYLGKWRKSKIERQYNVFATFWCLGGSGWRLLGSILGDLDHKLGSLGRSWRQVGDFLATCWD